MGVGNRGAGVRSVIPDPGNDGVGVVVDVGDGGV